MFQENQMVTPVVIIINLNFKFTKIKTMHQPTNAWFTLKIKKNLRIFQLTYFLHPTLDIWGLLATANRMLTPCHLGWAASSDPVEQCRPFKKTISKPRGAWFASAAGRTHGEWKRERGRPGKEELSFFLFQLLFLLRTNNICELMTVKRQLKNLEFNY
jgi:hypothetical protein